MTLDQPAGDEPLNTTIVKRSRRTIRHLDYYEVTNEELDSLDRALADSSDSLTFAATGLGVFVSFLIAVLTTSFATDFKKWLIFFCVTLVSGTASIWTGRRYFRNRNGVRGIIDGIRNAKQPGALEAPRTVAQRALPSVGTAGGES